MRPWSAGSPQPIRGISAWLGRPPGTWWMCMGPLPRGWDSPGSPYPFKYTEPSLLWWTRRSSAGAMLASYCRWRAPSTDRLAWGTAVFSRPPRRIASPSTSGIGAAGDLGLLHAGWRGVAAGILPRALHRMRIPGDGVHGESLVADILVHLGPAICGRCYEVDEPVLGQLGFEGDRALVDLRGVLVGQATEARCLAFRALGLRALQRLRPRSPVLAP